MLATRITFALSDWIRDWLNYRDKNPSIEEYVKFVEWKLEIINFLIVIIE